MARGDREQAYAMIGEAFGCAADLQQVIAAQAHFRSYPQRSAILHAGEQVESVYLVTAGLAHALAFSLDGRLVLVQQHGPGDIFGEGSLLGDIRIDEDIVAVEATDTAQFRALTFTGLIENYSCVALSVSRLLTRRLAHANRRLVEGATLSSNGRIYAELLRRARQQGGDTIRPAPVLSELAMHVQTARETVSRAISFIEKRGIIKREPGCLTIVAPHRLEELVV